MRKFAHCCRTVPVPNGNDMYLIMNSVGGLEGRDYTHLMDEVINL